ncbi:MAG: hypothetical protein QOJ25_1712 [Solirubrobacteraceae bacterium]|jgi:hypothetical protein|nr:hypothetical protein [Solirubrobacteraceae bacterium]
MTAALTPTIALQYLAELEPAILAVAVVGADGTTLAGDRSLAGRLAVGSEGMRGLLTARAAMHVVIAEMRPGGLEGLVRHDLEMVARELG